MTSTPPNETRPTPHPLGVFLAIVPMVVVAICTLPTRARACSCASPTLERRSLPADGARSFPVDGTLRVFLNGGFPEPLRRRLAEEYRLLGPDGASVPLRATLRRDRLDLRPTSPLEPEARYTLQRIFAFDGAGVRISDTRRWRYARKTAREHNDRRTRRYGRRGPELPTVTRRAWFPVATFETARRSEERSLPAPTVDEAKWGFAYGGGDCGPAVGLSLDVSLPEAVGSTDVLELEIEGRGLVETTPARSAGSAVEELFVGDFLCDPQPVSLKYDPGARVRLRIVDADGTALASTDWLEPSGRPRRALNAAWRRRRKQKARRSPIVEPAVDAWFDAPMAERTEREADASRPAACPHGFRSDGHRRISSSGGPWASGDDSTLLWRRGEGWLALDAPAATSAQLLRFGRTGKPRRYALGTIDGPEDLAAGDGRLFVVSIESRRDGPTTGTLHAIEFDGDPLWSKKLGPGWAGHGIAHADGSVFVAWPWQKDVNDYRLAWMQFDAATGERQRRRVTERAISQKMAVTAAEGAFAVATSGAGFGSADIQLTVVGADGSPRHTTLPMRAKGAIDMTAHGPVLAIAASRPDGEVELSTFDLRGRRISGPSMVSTGVGAGDNRAPAVTWISRPDRAGGGSEVPGRTRLFEPPAISDAIEPTIGDGFFTVAWQTSRRTYATAVDLRGRVSPALALRGGEVSTAPGVADAGGSVAASFTGSYRDEFKPVFLEMLQCRAEPAAGAPQQIAPMR